VRTDVQVLRDFRAPEGTAPDDLDANGDGEVLAILDLRADDSLVEAGLAREVFPPALCFSPLARPAMYVQLWYCIVARLQVLLHAGPLIHPQEMPLVHCR
jgi:hypothetical protein